MQYCENCGASLRENAKFCDQCGALVHIGEKEYCQHCHSELEPGALFCPECGYRVVEKPDPEPEPEPVPDPTPPPEPKPDPKPDPLEQQSSTPPQPLLNVGRNAFFAAVIAAVMSVLGALMIAKGSSWMEFGDAFLLSGSVGIAVWMMAVGFFTAARNYQKAAQRESDPKRQRLLERSTSTLVNFSYLLVVLEPFVLAFVCINL